MVLVRIAAGALLLAHGLVHLLYLVDDVREFSLDRSWLVGGTARRPVALVLLVATFGAFAVVGSVLSITVLVLFWNSWLVLGLAIDLAVLAVAVIRPGWTDRALS